MYEDWDIWDPKNEVFFICFCTRKKFLAGNPGSESDRIFLFLFIGDARPCYTILISSKIAFFS